uniref:PIG-P domain-containing protein n=1 Tax=Amphimedon queenslandica TaxID=400682 RepID=A0A1X7TUK6_AMPQE
MAGLIDPSRGIYGFVFYLVTLALFGIYLLWAILPDEWLQYIGLSYLPQKYWAIVVPLYIGVSSILLLLLYVCYSMWLTPPFDDLQTITAI